METETKYEEMILQELRSFPEEAIPQVIHILRSVRKGVSVTRRPVGKEAEPSGLSGIWKDDRSAAEIIEDIRFPENRIWAATGRAVKYLLDTDICVYWLGLKHKPSARIAGKGRILGDIMSPAAPVEEWNCAK